MGAPLDVLGAFGRVVEDEVRHVDVAADVLNAMGVAPTLPRDVIPPVLAWKDDAQSDEQVVAGLVSFFCVGELEAGRHEVENAYGRAVTFEGNIPAQRVIEQVFEVRDRQWRGIGLIPASGWGLRAEYAAFDAERRWDVSGIRPQPDEPATEELCGDIRRGGAQADIQPGGDVNHGGDPFRLFMFAYPNLVLPTLVSGAASVQTRCKHAAPTPAGHGRSMTATSLV